MEIIYLDIKCEEIDKVVLVRYYQSECLYILRRNGDVISTDNLNGIYSITRGENLTKEFYDLFVLFSTDNISDNEYEEYMDKIQLFLNKTQDLNCLEDNNDLSTLLKQLNDEEVILIIRYANCLK